MRNSSTFAETVYETLTLHMPEDQYLTTNQSILDILDGSSIGSWTIEVNHWGYPEFSDKWEQLLGIEELDAKEQLHRTIQAVHPDDRERVQNFFHVVIKSSTPPDSIEYRLVLGRQTIWVMTKGKILFENGQPVKYYASCFDITHRKDYEEQLQLKNRLISDFFTNISHEFRTPLAIMLMDLDLMDMHLRNTDCSHRDRINHNVVVMRQNTYRMFRLISNLLDVTAVNAGTMSLHNDAWDVVKSAEAIANAAAQFAEKKGIRMCFHSELQSRMLLLDYEKFERVLLNLLSNAIKHTPPGGHIQVTLADRSDTIALNVKDNGEGIPEDKKDGLFNMFKQVNTSLTRNNEGVGIGLALCKGLVELMGGKICFSSKHGEGSTFSFRLPARNPPEGFMAGNTERIPLDKRVDMEFSDLIDK